MRDWAVAAGVVVAIGVGAGVAAEVRGEATPGTTTRRGRASHFGTGARARHAGPGPPSVPSRAPRQRSGVRHGSGVPSCQSSSGGAAAPLRAARRRRPAGGLAPCRHACRGGGSAGCWDSGRRWALGTSVAVRGRSSSTRSSRRPCGWAVCPGACGRPPTVVRRGFPVADDLANIAVNALVMDPTDPQTLYAGTGEGLLPRGGPRHRFAAAWRRDLQDHRRRSLLGPLAGYGRSGLPLGQRPGDQPPCQRAPVRSDPNRGLAQRRRWRVVDTARGSAGAGRMPRPGDPPGWRRRHGVRGLWDV